MSDAALLAMNSRDMENARLEAHSDRIEAGSVATFDLHTAPGLKSAAWRLRFVGAALVAGTLRRGAGAARVHVMFPAAGEYEVQLLLIHEAWKHSNETATTAIGKECYQNCSPSGHGWQHDTQQYMRLKCNLQPVGQLNGSCYKFGPGYRSCMDACGSSCGAPTMNMRRIGVSPSHLLVQRASDTERLVRTPCVELEALSPGAWWNASRFPATNDSGPLLYGKGRDPVGPWIWRPHACSMRRPKMSGSWRMHIFGNSLSRELKDAVMREVKRLHLPVSVNPLAATLYTRDIFETIANNFTASAGDIRELFTTMECGKISPTLLSVSSEPNTSLCTEAASGFQRHLTTSKKPRIILQAIPASTPHAAHERVLAPQDGWRFDGSRGWCAVDELHRKVATNIRLTLLHNELITGTLDEFSMGAPFWDVSADGLHWGYGATTSRFMQTVAHVLLASL